MPRTTLNLDQSVIRELRERSAREHKSIGELASQLLAHKLSEKDEAPRGPFSWISHDLGKPAIDLEDKEALNSLLDK